MTSNQALAERYAQDLNTADAAKIHAILALADSIQMAALAMIKTFKDHQKPKPPWGKDGS